MARPTREESKQETREALLLAALELFREKGFDAPSLDAICERAGYTRGAFYVHFQDRDELGVAVMERVMRSYTDTIVRSAERAGDLERTVRTFAAALDGMRAGTGAGLPSGAAQLHLLLEGCRRSEETRRRFVELVEDGIAQLAEVAGAGQEAGTVRADLSARDGATLLALVVLGLLAALETGLPVDPARVRDAVLTLLRPAS